MVCTKWLVAPATYITVQVYAIEDFSSGNVYV